MHVLLSKCVFISDLFFIEQESISQAKVTSLVRKAHSYLIMYTFCGAEVSMAMAIYWNIVSLRLLSYLPK